MAEYLLRDSMPDSTEWKMSSAGTFAVDGIPASVEGVQALAEEEIDMRQHLSRRITREQVEKATIIIAMTRGHRSHILSLFPDTKEFIFLLKSFDKSARTKDLSDPIGAPLRVYKRTRKEICAALPGLIEFMNTLTTEETQ